MVPCTDFNLQTTLASGQVFRWRRDGGAHLGWIEGRPALLTQENSHLSVAGVSPEAVRRFFCLDTDLPALARRLETDERMRGALRSYWGLRLIRQDPWECTASFILSAFNNIPRLTAMIERLAARYGEPVAVDGARLPGPPARSFGSRGGGPQARGAQARALWKRSRALGELDGWRECSEAPQRVPSTPASDARDAQGAPAGGRWVESSSARRFPRAEELAKATERGLRACGLGYRAPHLKAAARAVAEGRADLEAWCSLEDEELRRRLLEIPGVGEKVVECILLFGYGREAAFPVDVWIGRAMRRWYFGGRKVSDAKIRAYARRRFGAQCGWAQQYLYCLARNTQ